MESPNLPNLLFPCRFSFAESGYYSLPPQLPSILTPKNNVQSAGNDIIINVWHITSVIPNFMLIYDRLNTS